MTLLLKAVLIGLLLALAEMVNGTIRVRMLTRQLGKQRAGRVGFFLGVAIIFSIAWLALPWLAPADEAECFIVGGVWLVILLALDLYVGRCVFRFGWRRIAEDFNPLRGNWLSVGMLFLFLSPVLVFRLQA